MGGEKTKKKNYSREHKFPVDNSSPRAKGLGPTGTDDRHPSTSKGQSEEGNEEANELRVSREDNNRSGEALSPLPQPSSLNSKYTTFQIHSIKILILATCVRPTK